MVGRKIGWHSAVGDIQHRLNAHIAKDAVVVVLRSAPKPAEEQEHITRTDTVFGEMRLRRAMLSKGNTTAITEKRIVMAPRRVIAHMIGKADVTIARAANIIGGARWDRQADRAAIDNR